MMKRYIVITTVYEPTEAVLSFSKIPGHHLVVVGDKKTPNDWFCDNANYLGVDSQSEIGLYLHKVLPFNHYCRKMMGYLYSIANGADVIIDTDDDNIPYENWSFPGFTGIFSTLKEEIGFINIYQLYTDKKVWPRGLPLNNINNKFNLNEALEKKECNVGIWQGLADEDPDVDAIYRLVKDEPVYFEKSEPVVLGKGTISPFNTQNTIVTKELFPLLYLPTYVTFRFTDILRGLIAQPIMWAFDYQLGFTGPSVVQKRNPHDYFEDFLSEIPMYLNCEKVIDITNDVVDTKASIHDNLFNVYEGLNKHKIVESRELETLEAWIKDLEHLTTN